MRVPLLRLSSMKGVITWKCISCDISHVRPVNFEVVGHGCAARLAKLSTFVLSARRHINVHTLCRPCALERIHYSSTEQLELIQEKRSQTNLGRNRLWARREWDLWTSVEDCQKINRAIETGGQFSIRLVTYFEIK